MSIMPIAILMINRLLEVGFIVYLIAYSKDQIEETCSLYNLVCRDPGSLRQGSGSA